MLRLRGILNHIVLNSVHSAWYTQIIFSLASLCHKAGTYKPMCVKPAVNLDGTMKVWIIHSFHSCLEVLLLLSPHGSAVPWLLLVALTPIPNISSPILLKLFFYVP